MHAKEACLLAQSRHLLKKVKDEHFLSAFNDEVTSNVARANRKETEAGANLPTTEGWMV